MTMIRIVKNEIAANNIKLQVPPPPPDCPSIVPFPKQAPHVSFTSFFNVPLLPHLLHGICLLCVPVIYPYPPHWVQLMVSVLVIRPEPPQLGQLAAIFKGLVQE